MLCILSFFPAVAQNKVQWGMEVGAGMSAWMGKNADGSKPLFNPKVGVTLDIPLNWLVSFQTGLRNSFRLKKAVNIFFISSVNCLISSPKASVQI